MDGSGTYNFKVEEAVKHLQKVKTAGVHMQPKTATPADQPSTRQALKEENLRSGCKVL